MLLEFVFQEIFVMRDEEKREWDEWHERMVSSLLRDFKCLEYGEYLMNEFRLILRKSERHETSFLWSEVCDGSCDEINAWCFILSECKYILHGILSLLSRVDVFNINRR